ncbi:MAG: SpaH/EbpB family LPXTG-anchored major pilin [Actinomycetaceae bacterium]|nr:SpaH/EbpB family LPXTG-anchored major pilin [Actinomycetaceae bacterium]
MTKNGSLLRKRAVAGIAALTLGASGLMMTAAQATDSPVTYGDIDKNATGTIRIHKTESGSLNPKGDSIRSTETGDGINGVTFKLYPIAADLTTSAGWDTISKVKSVPASVCDADGGAVFTNFPPESPLSQKNAVSAITVTTQGQGIATANTVPLGAYLVCEQKSDTATNEAGAPVSVVRKAAPFIVTVPHPQDVVAGNGKKTGWIYEVNVFPKNTVIEAPKKTSQNLKLGLQNTDGMQYTISVKIPNLLKEQHFKHFVVIDQLPNELTDAKVTSVAITAKAGVPSALEQADYVVPAQITGGFLTVNFTPAGLGKLKNAPNGTVTVTIKAKVNSLGNGKIENTGYLVVDTTDTAPQATPAIPVQSGGAGNAPEYIVKKDDNPAIKVSNKTASTWGDIKIRKHDASDTNAGLEGAQFQVYDADQAKCLEAFDNAKGKFTAENLRVAKVGGPLAVGGDAEANKTFTTEKGGEVVIPGLFLATKDAASPGVAADPAESRCYIVQETKAPAGYVLPTKEEDRTWAVKVTKGATQDKDLDIANTKVSVPDLPLTGAAGRVLLMAGGLALVLGSMGIAMVVRRRKENA